jgi:hypothetical protein
MDGSGQWDRKRIHANRVKGNTKSWREWVGSGGGGTLFDLVLIH